MDMGKGKVLRAAAYVRVSTDEQAQEGYSLKAQEDRIRDYIRSRGWTLTRVYRDEGFSAFTGETRPGYDAMIAARETWDVIVTLKMDRLWRNLRAFLGLMDNLETWERGYVSVSEAWDTTTPMGSFVRDLFARLAQLESEQTSYRVKLAFDSKFETDGEAWFSRPPLGYTMKDGHLLVDEGEADTVRMIFAMACGGTPTMEMVRRLRKVRGKDGGAIAQVSVIQIVHNPVYAGYVYRNGILRKNGHASIVHPETFNVAQVSIYRRTSRHRRWPLIVGAERIEAMRRLTSGNGAAVYVPKDRPADLDERVADEAMRRPLVRRRK